MCAALNGKHRNRRVVYTYIHTSLYTTAGQRRALNVISNSQRVIRSIVFLLALFFVCVGTRETPLLYIVPVAHLYRRKSNTRHFQKWGATYINAFCGATPNRIANCGTRASHKTTHQKCSLRKQKVITRTKYQSCREIYNRRETAVWCYLAGARVSNMCAALLFLVYNGAAAE